ncbi:MAG: hypothetical protein ACC608_06510 [Anaerofustis sp.]
MADTVKIMKYLTDGPKTYHEICERFRIGTPTVRTMVKAHPSHFVVSALSDSDRDQGIISGIIKRAYRPFFV